MISEKIAFNLAQAFFMENITQSEDSIKKYGKIMLYPDLEKTESGWYAFYQTENHILHNDYNSSLVDNTPIFISNDGSLIEFRHL